MKSNFQIKELLPENVIGDDRLAEVLVGIVVVWICIADAVSTTVDDETVKLAFAVVLVCSDMVFDGVVSEVEFCDVMYNVEVICDVTFNAAVAVVN